MLASKDIFPKTHSGAKQMFGVNFVITGLIEKESAKFYAQLFDMRQKGDYEEFMDYEEETVMILLSPAKN